MLGIAWEVRTKVRPNSDETRVLGTRLGQFSASGPKFRPGIGFLGSRVEMLLEHFHLPGFPRPKSELKYGQTKLVLAWEHRVSHSCSQTKFLRMAKIQSNLANLGGFH